LFKEKLIRSKKMKKTTKTIGATIILATAFGFNAFAEGDMQCPKTAAPCFVGNSDVNTKDPINIDTKAPDGWNILIINMLQKIGFLF
jgi:hypothetical protein